MQSKEKDEYSDHEAGRRADDALKRMLSTPPKPHQEMKLGKSKSAKERPATKGRVHKGKTKD